MSNLLRDNDYDQFAGILVSISIKRVPPINRGISNSDNFLTISSEAILAKPGVKESLDRIGFTNSCARINNGTAVASS